MNWFLYIITQDFIADDGKRVKAGEAGVGQCSMAPGISDAYNGIMYIVPHNYIKKIVRERGMTIHPSASTLRKMIEDYYNKEKIIIIKPEDKDFFIE
tara:strand:+ start:180 stop:470 length:291 start_codon:yes stop_codon:yes gene_type:complete